MPWCEVWINLTINLAAGVIIFLVGFFWPLIPKSVRTYRLKMFFGASVLSSRFAIVYGTLQDTRPRFDSHGNPLARFQKQFHDGRVINISGPFNNIVGDCEIRASSYLAQNIGKAKEEIIGILSDIEAYKDLNYTMIALGSPSSNDISGFVMREPSNKFFQFGQTGPQTFIESMQDKKQYLGFQPPVIKDCAVILRIRNVRFPKYFLFVCAGLGEWGTSGASWYLATHWEQLYKEFKQDDFAILVEVDRSSDTSANRIVSAR
ncbi:MAG: hypothetical protein ABSF79_08405 [Smithellaceae bacterium]|jgi:hypothetical protein